MGIRLVLGAGLLLVGCGRGGEGDGVVIPPMGMPTLVAHGTVMSGVAPSGGDAIAVWVVSAGSPDYVFKFGDGSATGSSFDVDFPSAPPEAAINAGVLGVGLIAVLSSGPAIPDGMVDDEVLFETRVIGVTTQHAVIWRPSALPMLVPPDHWIHGFGPGYTCGRCVEEIECGVDADCPGEGMCDPELGVCVTGSSFDAFVPVSCAEMRVDSTAAEFCNWT